MKKEITKIQKLVLATIKDLTRKNGKPPTLEELRQVFDYSSISSVQRHLDALKKKGFITSEKHHSRSLEVNLPTEKKVNIPLVGNVACGTPFLAQQNIEAYIPYEKSKLGGDPRDYFFLRAVGDSMNLANIDHGDYVLVKKQSAADFGQRVVTLIGNEATIKKLKKGVDCYILEPESDDPKNKPIYIFEDFTIQGTVKDVIKMGNKNGKS